MAYFFPGRTSSLLRLSMESLPNWHEETDEAFQRAADATWREEKPPRCVLWILQAWEGRGALRELRRNPDISGGIQSRLDGMKCVATKADLERAFILCRNLGLQGFAAGRRSFSPRTWILPEQRAEFELHVRNCRLDAVSQGRPVPTYILKPSGGSEGLGIFLLRHECQVPRYKVATIPIVAQDYISPLLLDDKKFDFRLYVLIRSVDPLEVYLHREGLARFCTEDYEAPTDQNLGRAFAHLTNYSLNKQSDAFITASSAEVAAAVATAASARRLGSPSGKGADLEQENESDEGDADDGVSDSSGDTRGRFSYSGCSKRPVTQVMKQLEASGAVRTSMLWKRIEELVALTAIAIQPELALQYRTRFPRNQPPSTAAEAVARTRHCSDSSVSDDESDDDDDGNAESDQGHHAFHVIGLDVLIDDTGHPQLLEINSKPSMAIDVDGGDGEKHRSPIDVEVKQRIMTDMLSVVGGGERPPALRPILGGDARRKPPRTTELLDRLRQLFDWITASNAGSALDTDRDREITSSKFMCFARSSGLLDVVPGTEVQLIFARFCRTQEESKEVRTKSYQIEFARPTPSGHTPVRGDFRPREQQQRMRFPAFARALSEMADIGYATLSGPVPQACSHSAARLESLLNYLADYQPRASAKPRARSASAWQHRTLRPATSLQKPPSNTGITSPTNNTENATPATLDIKRRVPSHIVAPLPRSKEPRASARPPPTRLPANDARRRRNRQAHVAAFEQHFILPWRESPGARPQGLKVQLRAMRAYFGTANEKERLMRQLYAKAEPRPKTALPSLENAPRSELDPLRNQHLVTDGRGMQRPL